jgi:hypothetical protein
MRRRSVVLEALKRLDAGKIKIGRRRSVVVKPRLNEDAAQPVPHQSTFISNAQPVPIQINPVPHQSTFISKNSSPMKRALSVRESSSETSHHTQADLYLALELVGERASDKIPREMLQNLSSQSKLNLMVASAIISHDEKATKEYVQEQLFMLEEKLLSILAYNLQMDKEDLLHHPIDDNESFGS